MGEIIDYSNVKPARGGGGGEMYEGGEDDKDAHNTNGGPGAMVPDIMDVTQADIG